MTIAFQSDKLTKSYGRGPEAFAALSDLTLVVPSGGVFGLLGPNGAGKSTLLRIMTGLVRPSSGSVRLLGGALGPATLRRIGALVEAPGLYPYLTAAETLRMLERASGIRETTVQRLLDRVGLADVASRRVEEFSLGMKQRLAIATALLGDPELIILDEPTNGMDPAGIQDIRRLIRDLSDVDGRTVLLSSHLLGEVQRVCDDVAILSRGHLVAHGRVSDLVGRSERLRIEAHPIEAVVAKLGSVAERDGDAVLINITRAEGPALAAALIKDGIDLIEMRWLKHDLEAVFFAETAGS